MYPYLLACRVLHSVVVMQKLVNSSCRTCFNVWKSVKTSLDPFSVQITKKENGFGVSLFFRRAETQRVVHLQAYRGTIKC